MKYVLQCRGTIWDGYYIVGRVEHGYIDLNTKLSRAQIFDSNVAIHIFRREQHKPSSYHIIKVSEKELFKAKLAKT